MGFFGRFSAPKANIELKLDAAAYTYTDKLSGLITFDPLEDVVLEELRLELQGYRKLNWKKGFSGYGAQGSYDTVKIPLTGSMNAQKGQRFEQSFQVDIPFYARSDVFMETGLKAKAVVAVKGRPDITAEVPVNITFPYVVECLRRYGGCGFVSPPSDVAINTCPSCGSNLEEQWNKKYNDLRKSASSARPRYSRR